MVTENNQKTKIDKKTKPEINKEQRVHPISYSYTHRSKGYSRLERNVLAPPLCCCCAEYRPRPTGPYPNNSHPHPPLDPDSLPSALKNVGHSLRSSGRDVGSFPVNERIAAASSSWTCWCFERTNLDALRHCRVHSHLCLFKQFGGR